VRVASTVPSPARASSDIPKSAAATVSGVIDNRLETSRRRRLFAFLTMEAPPLQLNIHRTNCGIFLSIYSIET
jgi:hypothetical protein